MTCYASNGKERHVTRECGSNNFTGLTEPKSNGYMDTMDCDDEREPGHRSGKFPRGRGHTLEVVKEATCYGPADSGTSVTRRGHHDGNSKLKWA